MSYGPVRPDVYRAICVQLDQVLKGAEPAGLPVEQPTKFELAINLKTANTLGYHRHEPVAGRGLP